MCGICGVTQVPVCAIGACGINPLDIAQMGAIVAAGGIGVVRVIAPKRGRKTKDENKEA